MARKLRVELDVNAEKAKRKVKSALEEASATGGASVGGGASGAADEAAKSLKNLGNAAKETNVNMKSVAKAFTGIGVGLATSYAANYMKPGAGRDAVEYGASAITGAAMGAMVGGPVGAAVGGVAGLLKAYLEKNAAIEKATEDFIKSDDDYEENRLWQKKLRDLTEVEPAAVGMSKEDANKDQAKKVDERLAKVKEQAIKLFDEQNRLVARITDLLKSGKTADAEALQKQLATLRMRKEQMEALERSYEKQKKSLAREAEELALKGNEIRTSTSATDALQKIGGMMAAASTETAATPENPAKVAGGGFAFSVPVTPSTSYSFGSTDPVGGFEGAMKSANERIESLEKEGNDLLKSIDEHIKGKDPSSTWQ